MKQSIDWNDDGNDDPGATEDIPNIDNDGREQASETKQDASNPVEENEWDKLLRLRCACLLLYDYLFLGTLLLYFISLTNQRQKWEQSGRINTSILECMLFSKWYRTVYKILGQAVIDRALCSNCTNHSVT